ncbi:Hypothetical protein CINCED_3A010105 [Cinara cedri]|uniref:Uncharacterized protein n=1 Tax=Cinara cedri TaxID=506608 RepID=A0A5E4MUZ0_9HEMI|nr:Hypothetical protein CINCED_3A010105 [Cinara cedri]
MAVTLRVRYRYIRYGGYSPICSLFRTRRCRYFAAIVAADPRLGIVSGNCRGRFFRAVDNRGSFVGLYIRDVNNEKNAEFS